MTKNTLVVCDTSTEIDLLHKIELEILKEFLKISKKYSLKYYILHGTLLGAVRHKGFIPWDDDLDICMPRKDYENFLEIASKKLPDRLKIINYRTDPSYHYYITRIIDTNTKLIEERMHDETRNTHVCIDVFPIDGSPNNYFLRKIYYFRVLYHRALMSLCYKDSIDRKRPRKLPEKVLLWIMEKIPVEKMTTPYKQKCKIDKLLKSQNVEKSKYIGNIMGAYRTREMVPKKWYGKGKIYEFENMKLCGLEKYDDYLSYTYGDYMESPPTYKRKTHFKGVELIKNKKTN